MMVALKAHFDGKVIVPDEPVDLRPGDPLLVHVQILSTTTPLTAQDLARSTLVGLWRDRDDIQDSASYARQLRDQAQRRRSAP